MLHGWSLPHLRRWSPPRSSRPAAVAVAGPAGPGRKSGAARTATGLAGSVQTCTCSADERRPPHRPCRFPAVARTPADGRWCPTGRRWSPGAAASRRAAAGGSCRSTSDRRRRRRRHPRPPPGDHPALRASPIDRIRRRRGRTMTSFPAEVRCIRTPCPAGGEIYHRLVTGSEWTRARPAHVRCRKAVRSAP